MVSWPAFAAFYSSDEGIYDQSLITDACSLHMYCVIFFETAGKGSVQASQFFKNRHHQDGFFFCIDCAGFFLQVTFQRMT